MGLLAAFVATLTLLPVQGAAAECRLSAAPVVFGSYSPLDAAPATGEGEIRIACTQGIGYRITLDAGHGSTPGMRGMTAVGEAGRLLYNLFLDSAHQRIWGDGTGASMVFQGVGTGRPDSIPIYGLIFPNQSVHIGAYRDFVTVILEF